MSASGPTPPVLDPLIANDPLCKIAGIDHATAMLSAMGSLENYRRLLAMFVQLHGEDPQRLRILAEDDAWPALRKRLHTLKGAAGYLALSDLVAQLKFAEQLAEAAQDPVVIRTAVAQVLERLEPLLAAIAEGLALHDAAHQTSR
jgi:HPt (histidine-containing phosphotransfer) domain-containing protein